MKRFCKYCGKDITNEKYDRITCYSKECLRKHDSFIRKNKKKENFCVICGADISEKHAKAKVCDNKECIKEYRRIFYNNRKKEKKCLDCGEIFYGTGKKIYCDKCANIRKFNKNFTLIEKEIKCKYCGKTIEKVLKVNTKKETKIFSGICDVCREINKQKQSQRMKKENPSFKEGQTTKKIFIPMDKEVWTKLNSDKMKIENPMFNPETVLKVKETFKKKIKNGELTYLRGVEHPKWKGNRWFNKHCRISLRNWVKEEFEKVDYTCQKCNIRGGELHVHHIEPLRDIMNSFLIKHNTNSLDIMKNGELLEQVTKEIVNYHFNNNIGIVVCKKCHSLIDKHYKLNKK